MGDIIYYIPIGGTFCESLPYKMEEQLKKVENIEFTLTDLRNKTLYAFNRKKYSELYSLSNLYLKNLMETFKVDPNFIYFLTEAKDKSEFETKIAHTIAEAIYLRGVSLSELLALEMATKDINLAIMLQPENKDFKEALKKIDILTDVVNEKKRIEENKKIPVTVITGFLGSGKTTLLNYILSQNHGKKIAVIENEFGEVGIDELLISKNYVESADEIIVEMNNGCICCTVRGDLIKSLGKLLDNSKTKGFDAIFIETTGLADPAPVAQTFYVDDSVREKARLDGIITMVDAKHILQHLDEVKEEGVENESVEQIAFADVVLLNKIDLVEKDHLEKLKKKISSINSSVKIIETKNAIVDLNEILNIHSFSLDNVLKKEQEFLNDQDHEHDQSVTSSGIKYDGEVDGDMFESFISVLLREKGVDLFRSKGVLAFKDNKRKYVFHAIHMLYDGQFGDYWENEKDRKCQLIFIGRNLDYEWINSEFEKCKIPK